MNQLHLDHIWNRAALENGGSAPREGDRALAALLRFHGLVMNGGVHHATEALSEDERRAAAARFRFFQLHEIADLLEHATVVVSIDDTVQDGQYAAIIPSDSFLFDRVAGVFAQSSNLFAPT